jgi:hypothetical protein
MNIGRHLKELREQRNMTLRQISDSTKLSTTTLQCIERNEFDRLPGGIFVRSYIRSFALEVGASADDVVQSYVDQFMVVPTIEEAPPVPPAPRSNRLIGTLAIAGVALVLALLAWGSFPASAEPPVTRSGGLLESRTMALFVRHPVGAEPSRGVERPAERGVRLEIEPTEKTWVSARADGQRVVRRFVQKGERVSIVARQHVILYVGKTKGFVYTLNGAAGRPLGEAARPVQVRITEANYKRFQAGAAAVARGRAASTN